MKYLEAKEQDPNGENKMQRGSRTDQSGTPKAPNPTDIDPKVRTLAGKLGVALHSVTGTGKGGAITLADVEQTKAEQDERAKRVANDPKA